LRFDV